MVHSRRGFSNQRRQSTTNSEENRRSTILQQRRSENVYKCKLCNKFHALKVCRKFLKMSPKERNIRVLREVYCVNCLARSHRFRDCRSRNMCKKCGRPHNTLLHPNYAERKSRMEVKIVRLTTTTIATTLLTTTQPNKHQTRKCYQKLYEP
ncbi:uncharacterized protein LOC142240803 [Haematobia irritans]|uniref:uncharacterized protein LOC142240803 n=1 Tax=Haematobia irritans TaxID=7368 RepID=UPI003F50CE0F